MNWQSAEQFFAMGGYALYVWSSFGMGALVLLLEPILLRARYQRARALAEQQALATLDDEPSADATSIESFDETKT